MARHGKLLGAFIITVLFLLFIGQAQAISFGTDPDAVEKAAQSVLMLEVYNDEDILIGRGSGFVAFDNFTLITNYHVMENAAWIMANSDAGNQYMITKVIAADPGKDIAILEFFSPTDLEPLPLNATSELRRIEPVVAIGSPIGVKNSVSTGTISALYEKKGTDCIQFTAPISHGSSGGALFNDKGEVIGITSGFFSDTQNMNLAVHIGEVVELYNKNAGNQRIRMDKFSFEPTQTQTPTPTPIPTPTPTPKPTPSPTPKPPVVTGLKTSFSDNNITLTWDPIPLAEKFFVYTSNDGNSYHSAAALKNQYVLENVEAGKTYYFKVSFVFIAKESEPSTIVKVYISGPTPTPKPPLAAPSNVKGTASAEGITITWDKVPNVKSYIVYRFTSSGGQTMLERTSLTRCVDKNAQEPGVYSYKVLSSDGTALSADPVEILKVNSYYKISGELAVPRSFKAKASNTAVTLTWSKVKTAKEYAIYRATSVNGPYTKLAVVTAIKYTDKNAKRGGTYYYRIRSIDINNVSESSQPIKAVMPKPTPTPKPTATPYVEPKYPIEIGDRGYINTYKGYPQLNPDIVNVSKKVTVDGFDLTFYCEDVYNQKIGPKGSKDYYQTFTFGKTVKPGKTIRPGYAWLEGITGAKYINVAITKIKTSDGRVINIPEKDRDWWYWTLD